MVSLVPAVLDLPTAGGLTRTDLPHTDLQVRNDLQEVHLSPRARVTVVCGGLTVEQWHSARLYMCQMCASWMCMSQIVHWELGRDAPVHRRIVRC